jgi:sucrose synthase
MTCGLPTIATCHGGPAEIIVDGVSGFHIDPYHSDKAADILVNFFDKCKVDPTYWDKISQGGLERIYEKYVIFFPAVFSFINGNKLWFRLKAASYAEFHAHIHKSYANVNPDPTSFELFRYTWKLYSERLMTLTGVYGFWKYVSNLERRETRRYIEMFYALKYRSLVSYLTIKVHGYCSQCSFQLS